MSQEAPEPSAQGVLVTSRQRLVLAALDRQAWPRSASDIHAELRAHGTRIGLTTVYRALANLARSGVVHAMERGGETVYLRCGGENHVHLVCRGCGRILQADPVRLQGQVDGIGFRIDVVYGLCADCPIDNETPNGPTEFPR